MTNRGYLIHRINRGQSTGQSTELGTIKTLTVINDRSVIQMTKYSTESSGDDSKKHQKSISIDVSDWLKDALSSIVRRSQKNTRKTIRSVLEYGVVEYHKNLESGGDGISIPGEHIWEPEFRCINCKSANEYLFRNVQKDDHPPVLCLNCNERMSEEEATRLERGVEIQDMEPYTLEKEGTEIKHDYEGQFRSPMRFECRECNEWDLILPDPETVEALICPRCGNKGEVLVQHKGPVAKGFKKYPQNEYHPEPTPDKVGRGVSNGNYDNLEKAYQDGHER
jgi:transcription elongation factor Elf1